ncbi:MAG TPA: beta-L-arabinofuranosidase domain-containing protein [Flavitalea sp.]|nr:beta-L-arabinofuranosidase domain-containing protein [Flavitalea sp.]
MIIKIYFNQLLAIFLAVLLSVFVSCKQESAVALTDGITQVKVKDSFWGPKFDQWRTTTVNDVFNKFEGNYNPQGSSILKRDFEQLGATRNAFKNFDLVAEGKRGIGTHNGPPWYDGLVYETIRGAADFIARYPNDSLERRIDKYINRIAAAQASDPDGYINTYTELMEPDHRWGFNGGFQRWQHDVYNAGMLLEAGVHYYKATGKTKLLTVAVRFANYMYDYMGPAPKKNVVPAHSGPEEAAMKLYWLFKQEPGLKDKIGVPVNENHYYELAKFWLENRGHHVGLPLWASWGNDSAENWIKANRYDDPKYGDHRRPTWGDYAQDSIPVFEQKTIEGHAVRATLLATGLTTAAIENRDPKYMQTASTLWNNMVGTRMFITGGVGAIANDEKFGSNFYLPNDAYLETCAGVGAGFFSQRMNQLLHEGKYMDEFERVLYNNILTGISNDGEHYTYQNPLASEHHTRWEWHDCPCCPPMFLKMVSAVPDFIYLYDSSELYVNLFVGNDATVNHNGERISLQMVTRYPWDGNVSLKVSPEAEAKLAVKVRIPNWATGKENPLGLYRSDLRSRVTLKVNGESINVTPVDGYVTIDRTWKKGDEIQLELPITPRFVDASEEVKVLNGQVAIASGPIVYGLEGNNNTDLGKLKIDTAARMEIKYYPGLLGGINVITGHGVNDKSGKVDFNAIPYFAIGNIKPGDNYKVWVNSK